MRALHFKCGRDSMSLPFKLWDLLKDRKGGERGVGGGGSKGLKKNKAHNTVSDLIINLNHMKSSGLHPDGSQNQGWCCYARHASLNICPGEKVPLKHKPTCPHLLLLVRARSRQVWPHVTRSRNVAFGQLAPPIMVLFFVSSPLFWITSHDRFGFLHSVTHLKQSPAGCKHTLPPLCSPLTAKFRGYNIDATYFDAFRYKNIAAAPLWICSASFTLQSTSSGDWTYSSSLTTPNPGHPAAPGFKRRRAASWCLFELCVKYRYRKSPRGETHKALTVSCRVLVPITHLRGLFSCQLPRCNS